MFLFSLPKGITGITMNRFVAETGGVVSLWRRVWPSLTLSGISAIEQMPQEQARRKRTETPASHR
jgi:hypothetical protein